jgi:transposase
MTTSEKIDLAVWRYGIISRLLHRNGENATLEDEFIQLASQTFRKPDGALVSFSRETIRKWLYRYRHGGLSALSDAQRKNTGTHEVVSKIIERRLFELRGEDPQWTLAKILDQLIEESLWDRIMPSRDTLYRFAKTANLLREPHQNIEASARTFACQQLDQLWMRKLVQGKIRIEDLKQDLCDKIPCEDIELLHKCVINKPLLNRNRAIRILSLYKNIPHKIITDFLFVSESSLFQNLRVFQAKGVQPILSNKRKHVLKHEDQKNIEKLFSIIHSPPSAYGFNRTTWKHDDIIKVMHDNNMPMSKACVSKIIKKSGLSYRKARLVLTSNDPKYMEKVANIKAILSSLGSKEKFFSIDEYGPFAVKLQGGRSLVPTGTTKIVP